jgi:hypothetical protein
MAKAMARPEVRAAIIDDALRLALAESIASAHCANRATVVHRALNPDSRAAVKALANGMAATFLDFPLLDGTPLGRANREQVEAALTAYRTQSLEMTARANWLAAILQRLPATGTVADAISADEAKRLGEAARQ